MKEKRFLAEHEGDMKAVVGLLLILLKISHGLEPYCDGRQNGTQCFGPLGGTVVFQLIDDASEIFTFRWSNKVGTVLELRKGRTVINVKNGTSVFTPRNGTFRINNLTSTDAGEYKLEIFDSDGRRVELRTLQLTIQVPVSSVQLDRECLSQGQMRVSCSSEEGDSPQYSWTLDGRPLTDAQLLSGNKETNNITLKQDVSGQLVCTVRNHVSTVSREETISTCGFIFIDCTLLNGTHISQWMPETNNTLCNKTTTTTTTSTTEGKEPGITVSNKPATKFTSSTTPSSTDAPWYIKHLKIMAVILAALVILLVVGVALVYAHQKKQSNKINEEEDEQELTYADVKIVQRRDRQRQQRPNTEVEYGQVKFSERPQQTAEPTGDDCVYAKVHARS